MGSNTPWNFTTLFSKTWDATTQPTHATKENYESMNLSCPVCFKLLGRVRFIVKLPYWVIISFSRLRACSAALVIFLLYTVIIYTGGGQHFWQACHNSSPTPSLSVTRIPLPLPHLLLYFLLPAFLAARGPAPCHTGYLCHLRHGWPPLVCTGRTWKIGT